MLPTLEQLGIDQLTTDQRIVLAQEILDSVIAERNPPSLTAAQDRIIEERLAKYDANPAGAVQWEEIEAAARARCKS